MDTIFIDSENIKTSESCRLLLNFANKINLKRGDKYCALSNLSINCTWKNIKKSYKNNRSKISGPTWDEKFELPDGSSSVSDIQDCFEYIIKKYQIVSDDPLIRLNVNKKEDRLHLKLRQGIILNSWNNEITCKH